MGDFIFMQILNKFYILKIKWFLFHKYKLFLAHTCKKWKYIFGSTKKDLHYNRDSFKINVELFIQKGSLNKKFVLLSIIHVQNNLVK